MISPNKTWAGAIAGLAAGALATVVLAQLAGVVAIVAVRWSWDRVVAADPVR